MVVYSFYIFDRHAACIYQKSYLTASTSTSATASAPSTRPGTATSADGGNPAPAPQAGGQGRQLSAEDDAKLVFGTVFSLRNMVRKLGGEDDSFVSYRTSHYKLHYYETPTNLKFVITTDIKMQNLRIMLHQIYISLYVEYVVKNPLSPVEHPGGLGVDCELFEAGLETFLNTMGLHG